MDSSHESHETTTMELSDQAARDTHALLENSYQYEPLIAEDAVRVLNLEPASDFQSPLRGFITQHRLAYESVEPGGCKYSAVSYTWGDSTLSHELLIGIGTERTSLHITQNADLLLRYLRDTVKEISLWIDGVCLNQRDQPELAQQVPLMGDIYTHANKVHIWLGVDEIEDAQLAFSLIRRLELNYGSLNPLKLKGQEVLCIERFFNRRWFSRRWVIQELFFAHDAVFHCGHHTLSLSRMMAALNSRNYVPNELPGWGSKMLRSIIRSNKSSRKDLLSLLWDLHEAECDDRRDRIAAIYALADKSMRPPLYYNVGGWERMYLKIASDHLRETAVREGDLGDIYDDLSDTDDDLSDTDDEFSDTIDKFSSTAHAMLLHLCNFGSIQSITDNEVPSWVPNWSARRKEQIRLGRPWTLSASERTRRRYRYSADIILSPRPWKKAREWYKSWATRRGIPSPRRLEVSSRKLQVGYDFLTFIYGCGTLDQVVCPAQSEDFWDEVVRLVGWKEKMPNKIKDRFKRNDDSYHANYHMEVDSLSDLLVCILKRPDWPDHPHPSLSVGLIESVKSLCRGLYSKNSHEKTFCSFSDNHKALLRNIRSACKDMALLRVQSTVGYYWVLGPLNLAKGDWLIPIIPAPFWTTEKLGYEAGTHFMSLRPVNTEEPRDTWYPYPGSDPQTRLRRLTKVGVAEIDSVHITTKYVGAGNGCPIGFDRKFTIGTLMWKVFQKATEAASHKGLPGPVIFDII